MSSSRHQRYYEEDHETESGSYGYEEDYENEAYDHREKNYYKNHGKYYQDEESYEDDGSYNGFDHDEAYDDYENYYDSAYLSHHVGAEHYPRVAARPAKSPKPFRAKRRDGEGEAAPKAMRPSNRPTGVEVEQEEEEQEEEGIELAEVVPAGKPKIPRLSPEGARVAKKKRGKKRQQEWEDEEEYGEDDYDGEDYEDARRERHQKKRKQGRRGHGGDSENAFLIFGANPLYVGLAGLIIVGLIVAIIVVATSSDESDSSTAPAPAPAAGSGSSSSPSPSPSTPSPTPAAATPTPAATPATPTPTPVANPPVAGSGFDKAPHWFYKSYFMCTAADAPDDKKCAPSADWPACGGSWHPEYCQEAEKQTCSAMGTATMKPTPTGGSVGDKLDSMGGYGFMCPHLMLGSSELLAAARADGLDPDVHAYGVATMDELKCGQCAELENTEPKLKLAPKLTVQVFNTVADHVDVYMAGGGYGAHNGCSESNSQVKSGTPNTGYFYEKHVSHSEFMDHLNSLPEKDKIVGPGSLDLDQAIAWGGGIRGGKTYADCMRACTDTVAQCRSSCQLPKAGCSGSTEFCILDPSSCEHAFRGHSQYVTDKAIESCKWSFNHDLHWNRDIKYKVVACPASLVQLTGLRPVDLAQSTEAGFPKGIGFEKVTMTTTMEDCSAPTCARTMNNNLGNWQSGYDSLYTCNAMGEKMLDGYAPANTCSASR
ncbi:unnamed protein product [Amoebophrya sp. A120]|nr:unnamed protein product [Amoebophrya sp. A120]|eukprot:GSA120T00025421001.1